MRELVQLCDQHIQEPDFGVDNLCDKLNLSKSQLYRKIDSITGTTPNKLIRMIRIKRAAKLLRAGELNITQVMHEVGFNHPSHFSSSFKKYMGVNPSEYRKEY